ncbi:aminopeptidase P family protein [Rhizobium leguminosarum]|uniref:M24 family metallopeptidase n=1 Tax=Rhizobium leguminosarum TaxID=384 RepID=UPI001C974321|nr:Xaa-Pro peptidase family protein [Rhizobium leguminosarum]MBY5766914.1 aminopeptidase P family protein [Rhizobium leguminosarum]
MQFELAEYQQRVERLRDEMSKRELDAVILDDCEATAYFLGYDTSLSFYRAAVITASDGAFFVLRSLDAGPLTERSWVRDVVGHADWEDPVTVLVDKMHKQGLSTARIGLDLGSHALTVKIYQRLLQALPGAKLVDIDSLPWTMRLIKSAAEVEKTRRACEIGDSVIREIVKRTGPGMTERDLAGIAGEVSVQMGGDPGHPGIFGVRRGGDLNGLHGHLHDDQFTGDEVLHLEINPRFGGYGARMMRTMALGEPPENVRNAVAGMIELQDRQLDAIKPGALASDVDRIAREGAVRSGLRRDYFNITGYTMGYYPDYTVRASDFTRVFLPDSDWFLEEGMVFHMYMAAAGVGVSETVLVTGDGVERLTKIDRKLFTRTLA